MLSTYSVQRNDATGFTGVSSSKYLGNSLTSDKQNSLLSYIKRDTSFSSRFDVTKAKNQKPESFEVAFTFDFTNISCSQASGAVAPEFVEI